MSQNKFFPTTKTQPVLRSMLKTQGREHCICTNTYKYMRGHDLRNREKTINIIQDNLEKVKSIK